MNYSCLSCAAKYSIPDKRLAAAGDNGLRIRCSRCRAIMAVTAKGSRSASAQTSFDTFGPSIPTTPVITGVVKNPFADVPAPAFSGDVSTSSREVTGVFMPLLMSTVGPAGQLEPEAAPTTARLSREHQYFAAIEGRARGPFAPAELVMLADKGKIRGNTLLWRPGATGWTALKRITEYDVGYLKDAVVRRKRREADAADTAMRKRGIAPIKLERQTHGRRNMPPVPADADNEARWAAGLDDSPGSLWPQATESSGPLRAPTTSYETERRFPWRVAAMAAVFGVLVFLAGITFGVI